jgi:hypothetical protein
MPKQAAAGDDGGGQAAGGSSSEPACGAWVPPLLSDPSIDLIDRLDWTLPTPSIKWEPLLHLPVPRPG